jgi:hypothetical protein
MKPVDILTAVWHSIRKEAQVQESAKVFRDDPLVQLRQIKGLLDQGQITESDYEARKGEILSRL